MTSKASSNAVLHAAPAGPGAGTETVEPEPELRIAIDLVEDDGDWSMFGDTQALISAAAAAAARHVDVAANLPGNKCEVAVALSSNAAVARLNGQFRGKPKPTNVLSFPAAPDTVAASGSGIMLGDIVLAAETVRNEAEAAGLPLAHHLQHLVVHGILHLVGYDHLTSEDADEMEAIEIEVLATLGIADPYAGSELDEANA